MYIFLSDPQELIQPNIINTGNVFFDELKMLASSVYLWFLKQCLHSFLGLIYIFLIESRM